MNIQSLSKLTSQATQSPPPAPVSHQLSGDVVLPIHTKKVQALCQGSWASYRDMGLFQFAKVMTIIHQSVVQDDPYADWHSDKIEKELLQVNQDIKNTIAAYEQALRQWQGRLEVEIFGSPTPLKLVLKLGTPLGYIAAYTIGELDYLLRQAYTFKRLGIFPEAQRAGFELFGRLKTVLAQCRHWRHTGVTRQDIREKNQKAERAKALMGLPPSRILKQKSKSPKKEAIPSVKN